MSLELFDVNAALQVLKSKIAPPPTKATNPTKTEKEHHLSEMSGMSETAITEKLLLPDKPPQLVATDSKSVPMFTNVNGKPLHCIHCAAWVQGLGVWWSGACLHTSDRKNNKSRCTLEVWEVA